MWHALTSVSQFENLLKQTQKPIVIFKHSTRCSISSAALGRIERQWKTENQSTADFYYLDLLAHRDVSNAIAEKLLVEHQSPQILVIQNGTSIYHASHYDIQLPEVWAALEK